MSAPTARNQWPVRHAGWAAGLCAVAGFVLFHWFGNATRGYVQTRSAFWWWGSQWFDPGAETQHGPLILLIALWLVWRNLLRGAQLTSTPQGGRALAAMGAGVALHLAGYAMQQTRFSLAGMLVFAWGILALAGGHRWSRAAVFPLAFMLFAVPVNMLDSVGFHLRLWVTDGAAALSQGLGVDVVRNGTQLFAPDGRYQYDVAAACSGVRSLVALLSLALLVGYLSFRSRVAWALLVALSIPAIIAANIARVLTIVMVGEKFGHAAGENVHTWTGPLVFLIVLGLLLATVPLLRRFGFEPAQEQWAITAAQPSRLSPWYVAAGVVLITAIACGLTTRLDALPVRSATGVRLAEDGNNPIDLPPFIGTDWVGQRVDVTEVERQVLPADTGYSRRNYVSTEDLRHQVFFSIVLSGRDRTSIHRPELCLVGQGWTFTGRFQHEFRVGSAPLNATVLRIERETTDARGQRVVMKSLFAYWFVSSEAVEATHVGMVFRNALDRLRTLRSNRWAYIVVQTIVAEEDDAAAIARMQTVIEAVVPEVQTTRQPR